MVIFRHLNQVPETRKQWNHFAYIKLSETKQISMMECFEKIVNMLNPLTVFPKCPMFDWALKSASEEHYGNLNVSKDICMQI